MRRATLNSMAPSSGAAVLPPPSTSVSHSMLSVATAGAKRPRTVTAQGEALVLHGHAPPPPPSSVASSSSSRDQVVTGITAATGDELEDWSGDFEAHTPRVHSRSHSLGPAAGTADENAPVVNTSGSGRNSERCSGSAGERDGSEGGGGSGGASLTARMLRNFPRSSSLFQRPSKRSWQRQHSFDAGGGDGPRSERASRHSSNSRIRGSSNDAAEKSRLSASNLGLSASISASSLYPDVHELTLGDLRDELIIDDDEEHHDDDHEHSVSLEKTPSPEDHDDSRDQEDEKDFARSTHSMHLSAREDDDEGTDGTFDENGTTEYGLKDQEDDEGSVGGSDDDDDDDDNADADEDEDDEDEDWDVEFGFADAPDDDQDDLKPGGSSVVDSNRRRADNFNIFLRGFHDMMAGDEFIDEEEDLSRSRRARHANEETLFKRRRSDIHTATSIDGNAENALRSSLSSLPGTTEYSLVDKYRLLDVACSSSYAVRIERYPKPCVTYSNLERNAVTSAHFPLFSDSKLEQWLANVVRAKCEDVDALMTEEQANTPDPRHQKNHQFRTLVSIPFGKRFVDKCFKQISVYRFYGEDKSNRELIRVFFEKLATAGIADEHWSSKLPHSDLVYIAGIVMEVLQEAARMYGPVPATGVMTPPPPSHSHSNSSGSSRSNGATAFWMRQFQTILTICVEAFPTYRNLVALIELRFVCHHLVGLANSDLSYTWQVCNQFPQFEATVNGEPVAGHSAPIIANEIVQYYGALLTVLRADVEALQDSTGSIEPTQQTTDPAPDVTPAVVVPSKFGTSTDPHCLLALAVCDVQTVYSSRSALAETMIPELVELFEFEEDDGPTSFHEMDHVFGHESIHEDNVDEDPDSVVALLRPSSIGRRRLLEETLYDTIDMFKEPLAKARCASVMSSMHSAAAIATVSGESPHSHLKLAESLAYEALRVLEWVTSRRLDDIMPLPDTDDEYQPREPVSSVFANDGLLSDLGREILESLGNVLVKNQKYRFGILCLEAATDVFSLLNQGRNHERLDRLMCTLTTQAEDIKRALPLHEKVAASCLRQSNTNEFVFLTQTLTNMWLREGKFSDAEDFLTSAFQYLRDQTNLLPPFFLSSPTGSHTGSDSLSNSSRSGTALTASSSASSSAGSFVYPGGRGNTSEMDLWLNHDITVHLLLRDLYRASGRFIEAMRVLEYLLNYSVRLPRGKRTQLRMLLAEDSLQLRVLDTARYTFHLLDQEANYFCDRLLQSTLGGVMGGGNNNSSGGFGSSNGTGGSSSGGRSMGGMGSEARFCFDMVLSVRYILARAKLYLHLGELRHAHTWLSLAHIKNERESVRTTAKMHMLDGRILVELLRRQHEQRLLPEKTNSANELHQHRAAPVSTVEETMKAFTSSVYALSKQERQRFEERLSEFSAAVDSADKSLDLGVQAYWSAYEQFEGLDDRHHQLKALLGVIQCQLVPIERSFFALGSSTSDELLMKMLGACAVMPRRSSTVLSTKKEGEQDVDGHSEEVEKDETTIEGVRKTLQDCQRLLRQALSLSEQLAEPSSYFQTLVYCSQAWTWLERLAPYKGERPIKEAASFWEEAVKVMKAVYFRRVAFEYDPRNRKSIQQVAKSGGVHGPTLGGDSSTFSLVPILNFRESFILRLETMTLQLITTACQLQQFDRVPEYVEDMLVLHMDELLSARMCLNGIAHQLRSFRSQQQHQSIVRQIPLYSVPGPTAYSSTTTTKSANIDIAVPQTTRASFSSNSLPGVMPSSSLLNASGTKRKGHKKNQSMSSISELLTSSGGNQATTSSFHDLSLSFVSSSGRGTALSGGATPRTGLASLSDRTSSNAAHRFNGNGASVEASGVGSSVKSPESSSLEHGSALLRERSRSAPQANTPRSVSVRSASNDCLSPVKEARGGSFPKAPVRVVDLKDVRLWSGSFEGGNVEDFTNTNATTSSTAIGIYDFDDVQSERLWWIFNAWRTSKESYISGKTEVSAFRHQNLKTLRTLLDAFDPQQVAVLYSGKDKPFSGMLGFDVGHINSHTFIEDRGFVLCVGYDGFPTRAISTISASATPHRAHHHTRLDFKVFKSIPDKPSTWRLEIPRADWYLTQEHFFEGPTTSSGNAVLRTLKLFGAKLLLKLLASLLLENSLVIVGTSFPQIKEVTFCLLKLLRPFRWQHTFLPFLPIPSWRFLADSLNHHVQAQLAGRPKKMTLGLSSDWRWGSPGNSAPSSTRSAASSSTSGSRHVAEVSTSILEEEPPFIIGTLAETWHTCVQRLKTSSIDERSIPAYVNVVNLDDVHSFSSAKGSLNSVSFPRKLRKQFMERFDKVVKIRRKIQEKSLGPSQRRSSVSTRIPAPSSSYSIRSSFSQHSHSKLSKEAAAAAAADDDRAVYDAECASAFVTGLHDFYDRLASLSAERAKKLQGKKKHSKRQEFKSWFSSTHEFDAYVDKFLETAIYQRYEAVKLSGGLIDSSAIMGSSLSRSSSTVINPNGPGGGAPRSSKHAVPITASSTHALLSGASLARSFGSVSSNSSFNGHSSSTHHQL